MMFILFMVHVQASVALYHIPTLYLNTKDNLPVTSRTVWQEGASLKLVLADGYTAWEVSGVSVKSRGHSTFTKPKKPYVFKLPEKKGILGMPAGKKWILLANFLDHSNVRNSLALEISRCTSLDWTPSWRFVDVFLNGKLQGLYTLVEAVDVKKERLDLDPDHGFLLECDHYDDERLFYTAGKLVPFHIKYPERVSDSERIGIENRLNSFEKLLYKSGLSDLSLIYKRYIDLDSFVDWWIIHELAQNAEPNGPRSCYIHDRGDGRLRMGPVWDFDLAFIPLGLDDGGDIRPSRFVRIDIRRLTGDSLYNSKALWYDKLLYDKVFRERLKRRWKMLKPRFEALLSKFSVWERLLVPSANDNDALWKGIDPARFDMYETFAVSIANVKKTYLYRLGALDKLITNL